MNAWMFLLLIGLLLFSALVIGLIIIGKGVKRLKEDLNYVRHVLVSWLGSLLLRIYFWFLEITGNLRINFNGPIPWDEEVLIFVGNHPMSKLQDTFIVPISIYYHRPRHYLNPIRYFPITIADKKNFGVSKFFAIVGKQYIIEVDRSLVDIRGKTSRTYGEIKRRIKEWGSRMFIFNPEEGRTASAERYGKIIRESPEGSKLAIPLGKGAAYLSIETGAPIVPFWSSLNWDEPLAKPNPNTVLKGLLELMGRGRKMIIDIGHSDGPLRPKTGEKLDDYNQRIEDCLLALGDYQVRRSRRGKK